VNGPANRHRDTPQSFAAATPEEARALVREVARDPLRPDHIKTYDALPRASFFALMDEARRRGIEVSGHVPVSVGAAEASAAGMKAIAHARVLPIACSSSEAEIIRLRSARRPAAEWMRLALASQDPAKCAGLWRLLKAHGTFVSPTLITRYSETKAGLRELGADPAMKAATPWLVKLVWNEDVTPIEARGAEEEALYRRFYEAAAARTAEAERAGVRLLVGSDTNDVYVAPGVGFHQEIELWRRAGIPAAAIVRAATVNAAAYFGRSDIGRVEPGQVADLVLTDRNPLEAPATLRTPRAVIQEGRLYRRDALEAMTEEAQGAARSWRYTIHFLRDFLRNPMGFAN
jgi:imidazolonepropionase-like amidohydrolase